MKQNEILKSVYYETAANSWKQKFLRSDRSDITKNAYIYVMENKLLDRFSGKLIGEIDRNEYEEFISELLAHRYEDAYLRRIWLVINEIRKHCYEKNWIEEYEKWPYPQKKALPSVKLYPNLQKLMLKKIRTNDEAILMEIIFRENDLGLNRLIALRKEDVDLLNNRIRSIRKAVNVNNSYEIVDCQTKEFVISDESAELLYKQQKNNPAEYFFADEEGKLKKLSHYIHRFKQLSVAMGMEIKEKTLRNFRFEKNEGDQIEEIGTKSIRHNGKTYHYLTTNADTLFGRKCIEAKNHEELIAKFREKDSPYSYPLKKYKKCFYSYCKEIMERKMKLNSMDKEIIDRMLERYVKRSKMASVNEIDDQFKAKLFEKMKKEKCSDEEAQIFLGFIRDVCDIAVNNSYLYYNPFIILPHFNGKDYSYVHRSLNDEQIKVIMKLDSRDRKNAYLQIKLLTGLRTAEMSGLCWEDVLFNEKKIVVRHQLKSSDNGLINSTKNYRIRTPTVSDPVFMILDKLGRKDKGLIFVDESEKPLPAGEINELLKKVTDNREARLHDLRVTYATKVYEKTGDILAVSKDLGHADSQVTKKHYLDVKFEPKMAGKYQNEYYAEI